MPREYQSLGALHRSAAGWPSVLSADLRAGASRRTGLAAPSERPTSGASPREVGSRQIRRSSPAQRPGKLQWAWVDLSCGLRWRAPRDCPASPRSSPPLTAAPSELPTSAEWHREVGSGWMRETPSAQSAGGVQWAWVDLNYRPHACQELSGRSQALVSAEDRAFSASLRS